MAQTQILEETHVNGLFLQETLITVYGTSRSTANSIMACRHNEFESMVLVRRPGVHHCRLCDGAGHGTGPRLPLLRTGTKKIGIKYDMGLHGISVRYHIPMVHLGLLVSFQQLRNEWLYRRPE